MLGQHVDPRTVQFYATNAADLARRYIAAGSAPARHFPVAFTPGSRVLDIGCGSGRDLQALLDAGYDASGIDATHEMPFVPSEAQWSIAS